MDFDNLYSAVKHYTMLDIERSRSLWNLVNSVNSRGVAGDIVECGCCKGGSSAVLRAAMGIHRKIWIYDSFQGMPETTKHDGDEAKNWVGSCTANIDNVYDILLKTGADRDQFIIREGMFQDTFKHPLPEKVALLHCDADWYESVIEVLDTFYPRISMGGCIILDDFGYWEGCRKAFYDFCKKYTEYPLLERVGSTQAYWIKGKENNRNE